MEMKIIKSIKARFRRMAERRMRAKFFKEFGMEDAVSVSVLLKNYPREKHSTILFIVRTLIKHNRFAASAYQINHALKWIEDGEAE